MKKKLISIIIPCYNEAGNVPLIYAALTKYVPKSYDVEYLLIDDGSQDGTLAAIKKLARTHKEIKYLAFTRNFGHQYALKAGIDASRGQAVISIDADLQHPPTLIPQMLKKWEEGNKIVYGKRLAGQGRIGKNMTATIFYHLINSLSETKIEPGAADFRLLDKEVVELIKNSTESALFLRGLVAWSGFKSTGIPYKPNGRTWGETKYSYAKMAHLAIDAITSFSTAPLRFATILGLVMAMLSGLYGLYAVLVWLLDKPSVIIGWPSVIISVLFIGGLQLMIMGIIGEYVGKIFIEAKRRPLYLIKEKRL